MISVHLIRYKEKELEFLMIKRSTPGYNWQCVTGAIEMGETPLECAKREIFEEIGYSPSKIIPFKFPEEY